MHNIDYRIPLTNSRLFDTVMYAAAKKLCGTFPGLSFTYERGEIHIFGNLSDYWYQQYNEAMFRSMLPVGP